VYAALGSPNGLPLRHKIATGALRFEEFRMMACCGIVTDGPYQNDITVRRIPKESSAEVLALLREM
jgi:hypothetical protein